MRKLFALATLGIFLGSGIGFADNIKKREKSASKSASTRESRAGNSPRRRA